MKYLALAGPVYSGKTSVARALEEQGYMRLVFSEVLKLLTVKMMHAIGEQDISYEQFLDPKTKQKYRGFWQELGVVLDIDNDPRWMETACLSWHRAGEPAAVIEAIRTPNQARMIQAKGFSLVYLSLTKEEQKRRATALGVSRREMQRQLKHPVENHGPVLADMADIVLDASLLSVPQIVNELMRQRNYELAVG